MKVKKSELFELMIPDLGLEEKVLPTVEQVTEWQEIQDRRLILNEMEIVDLMYYNRLIMQWNKEDYDNHVPVENRKPIKILIYTYGGIVDTANSLRNIIQISKTPVHVYNLGVCASAGVLIFLSGHKRYAFQGSKFLIHEGEVGLGGQTTKVIENLEAIKKQEKELEEYILSKTKIDKKLYTKNKKKEWWISTDAVELGICDGFVADIEEIFE